MLEFVEDNSFLEEKQLTIDELEDFESMRAPSRRIDYRNQDYDVHGLVARLNSNEIIIPRIGSSSELVESDPFQRGFVWSKKQMDSFIESLLLEYPVPSLFFVRQEDRRLLVLDGQQRLETLRRFYAKDSKVHRLNLPNSPYDGKSYFDLPDTSRRILDNTYITSTIILLENKPTSYESVYDVFARLNSGGTQLTPHEIRMALYNGLLMSRIDETNRNTYWRNLYGTPELNKRFRDHELVLRIIALYMEEQHYAKPLGGFLNAFSSKHRNEASDQMDEAFDLFTNAAKLVATKLLGQYDLIRPFSSPNKKQLNAARADSIMVSLMRALARNEELDENLLKRFIMILNDDEDYSNAVTGATSDDAQVHKRIALAEKALANARQ